MMLYPDLDKGLKETGCKSHVRKAVFILKTHMHFKKQSHFISYNLLKKKIMNCTFWDGRPNNF